MGAGDAQGTGESGASLEQQGTSSQGLSQSHCPTAGQLEAPGQSQLRAAGTASDWGRARPGQEVGTWAGLALGTPGQARQGCGELETGAAAALLGQGLTALVLLLGRVGSPRGPGTALVTAGSPQHGCCFPS